MSPMPVVVPVGPGPLEENRVADLVASLHHHEPDAGPVLLVDDAPRQRRVWPASQPGRAVEVLPNPREGRGVGTFGGVCAATLLGLRWARSRAPGEPVLRLDTDALVIAAFARSVRAAVVGDPKAGVLGTCRRTPDGQLRDVSSWAAMVRRHARPLWLWRTPPHVQRALDGRNAAVRREVCAGLRSRGYTPGAHCMAAACVVTTRMAQAMAGAGMLDDPLRWIDARIGDDVMLGLQAAALGFELRGMVADGEPFGLRHIGLADTPQRLVDRGFAFIHSLKNDPEHDEAALRAFFAARREGR